MKLKELAKGQKAKVININTSSKELKQRFASFGLIKGTVVELIDYSLTKSNIEIMIDTTLLALRKQEANDIEVEVLK